MNKLEFKKTTTAAELVAVCQDPVRIVGDANRSIRCIRPLEDVCGGALTFSKKPITAISPAWKAAGDLVIIVPNEPRRTVDLDLSGVTLIEVAESRAYFIRALNILTGGEALPSPGKSPTATVAPDAKIGAAVHIGPNVWIGAGAVIGDGCILFGGAQIYDNVVLDAGCVVQANAIIGCHGQSFVREAGGGMSAMPHFGRVRVGARCRIGAGAVVVRGTLRDTVIGPDTSVGNIANIGHNVEIGSRCFIGPGALLAGSSAVGDDTWVSIGVIVRGAVIGKNAMIGAGAVVTRPVADDATVNGFPARVTAAHS